MHESLDAKEQATFTGLLPGLASRDMLLFAYVPTCH